MFMKVLVLVFLAALELEEISGYCVIMQTLLASTGEGLCDVSHFSEIWSKYQVGDNIYGMSSLSYI